MSDRHWTKGRIKTSNFPSTSVQKGMEAWEIVGAGGIGCAVGYALARGGCSVTFVDTNLAKLKWGRKFGVSVAGLPSLPAAFVDFRNWSPAANAQILLCTKCFNNGEVLAKLPLSRNLLSIQNGFDADLEACDQPAEAIASFVSECHPERTHTRLTRFGALHIGGRGVRPEPALKQAHALASSLRSDRLFKVRVVPDVLPFKFSKLMYNAAISPLAAAGGLDNGALLREGPVRRLFFALLQENYRILREAGKPLGTIGPFSPGAVQRILNQRWLARSLAWAFYPSLKGRYCSMSLDLPAGRTEIDNYNGYLLSLAGNVPCPLNRLTFALVKRMEKMRLPPGPGHLDELERAVQNASRAHASAA